MATLTTQPLTGSHARRTPAAELRAFWAVVRKEWIIFVRYPSWVIALFIWPIMFPLIYILTARALAGPDGSGLLVFQQMTGVQDYIGYITVGTTIWMWQNIVLWDVGGKLRNEQLRGTLESNWLTPTWRFSLLLGGSMVQMLQMMLFLAITALEFGLFFGVRFHGSPATAGLVLLAAIPSIYGIAIAFASVVISLKEINSVVYLVRGLVMLFCGITFPISVLPLVMQKVSFWLPQTHIIDAFRQAVLAGANLADLQNHLLPLTLFGAFWLAAGFLIFTWMERRARQTGAIGQY